PPTLTSVSVASNNSTSTFAKPGDVVTLSFSSSETINLPTVTIATHTVTASVTSGNSYTAGYTMLNTDAQGTVPFTINFTNISGVAGATVTTTTNGSSVSFDNTLPTVV